MEKTERTDKQTHEKIMNKSSNNQLIGQSVMWYVQSREWVG